MSATHRASEIIAEDPTLTRAAAPPGAPGVEDHRSAQHALAATVHRTLQQSGMWAEWQAAEPRLAGFTSLGDVREAWRRRDERCYQVVAGLTALGSRRGGDDDDAALAVVVLLEDGVNRVAATLRDLCELPDVSATVWEEVKAAEPTLGPRAARYLLQRARQRLTRPAAGMVARVPATSLDQRFGWGSAATAAEDAHDVVLVAPEADDPVADLADLLTWAQAAGVVARDEVDLLVELLAAENDGMAREEAQRAVGQRHGVTMRTIRRRRERTAARLREAAPQYLTAIA